MKTLFIGNITIDDISQSYRVGGSGYYGGRALRYLGIEVHIVSHVSSEFRNMIMSTMDRYGLKVIEISSSGTPIFVIERGKAVGFRGSSPRILFKHVEKYLSSGDYNVVLFTPIMNELGEDIIDVYRYRGFVKGLDIQGFVRRFDGSRIRIEWTDTVLRVSQFMDIVHGNIYEFKVADSEIDVVKKLADYSSTISTAFLVSMDERGTYLVYGGQIIYIPSLRITPIDDVGAGDVLLAVTSLYRARGLDIVSSTIRGVVAASLKVANAHGVWFDKKLIESYSREIENNVYALNR